jgi:UDP-2,4-diacetamido-2,4,6-trideoxy-beta-L-altropyranose hydrolase
LKIVIRVDASLQIGSGHVMRCLALAGALRERGAMVCFLCREEQGNLIELIEQQGYPVRRLPGDTASWEKDAHYTSETLTREPAADWLIVDHYSLDHCWERDVRNHARRLMVIDDLANRLHHCDVLLDHNLYEEMETRYAGLVPRSCSLLLGPRFALLRPEFSAARQRLRNRDGSVKRILIFFGGSDLTNETAKTLRAVGLLNQTDLLIDVVIGINNPHRENIEAMAAKLSKAACHIRVTDMAALMTAADLYAGAAGTTTWERCCLGLPSLVVTVADNQVMAARDLAKNGYLHYIGHHDAVRAENIANALRNALGNPAILIDYSKRCMALVDGAGTQRCTNEIMNR